MTVFRLVSPTQALEYSPGVAQLFDVAGGGRGSGSIEMAIDQHVPLAVDGVDALE